MAHSGINVLLEGSNFSRLMGGLWVSVWIAVVSLFFGLIVGTVFGVMPADWMAVLAFSLWVAAEFSDIVRGAIQSVPQHQRESGLAIGLTRFQLFRYILLPQAMKLEVPAAINLATRVVKTTSLLMIISIMDVINVGQQIIEANNSTYPTGVFWVYGLIFFLYFIVDYLLSLWARKLTARQ